MRMFSLLLLAPTFALAQLWVPTVFPSEAVPLTPEALKQRLAGKAFLVRPAAGAEMRLQYQETDALINIGNSSDSGKWRVEGSSVCVDWQKFPPGCSEVRLVGDVMYTKRASNGEIVILQPR